MKSNINPLIKATVVLMVIFMQAVSANAYTDLMAANGITEVPKHENGVVYQSIIATITEKSVLLDWNTVSEAGNNHFEVERSLDMNDFKTVALVLDGFNTQGSGKRYAFKEDVSVIKNNKVAYYRLKQFDGFGNITYSAIIKVQAPAAAH